MTSFTVSFIRLKVASAPAAAELIANAKSISSSVAVSATKERFDRLVIIQILGFSLKYITNRNYYDNSMVVVL